MGGIPSQNRRNVRSASGPTLIGEYMPCICTVPPKIGERMPCICTVPPTEFTSILPDGISPNPKCPLHGWDDKYWGSEGPPQIGKLKGFHIFRGCDYKDVGPTTDGAKNQRRSISSGRKARGLSSDGYKG